MNYKQHKLLCIGAEEIRSQTSFFTVKTRYKKTQSVIYIYVRPLFHTYVLEYTQQTGIAMGDQQLSSNAFRWL
jgi:hypothetical protein